MLAMLFQLSLVATCAAGLLARQETREEQKEKSRWVSSLGPGDQENIEENQKRIHREIFCFISVLYIYIYICMYVCINMHICAYNLNKVLNPFKKSKRYYKDWRIRVRNVIFSSVYARWQLIAARNVVFSKIL
jgi:hypothetical protein